MISAASLRTFGEKLRQARLEQQRSLEEIAAAIKINRHHLEAIEAGDLDHLPQGPYVPAFVREYARALGMQVPPEYAPLHAPVASSPRDPKVVSHPAHERTEESGLTQIARDTARLANTVAKGAVKTVAKTTESVVNLVESGSKEALEVLTSRELWEEAENIRRERHGLPPLERPQEVPPQAKPATPENVEEPEPALKARRISDVAGELLGSAPAAPRVSRKTTNIVIVTLAIVFGAVVYVAIRATHSQSGNATVASRDYIPAPVESTPAPRKQRASTPVAPAAPPVVVPVVGPDDSLQFQLRATQPVWVSIAPDGIPAYRGQMNTGEVRSFRAAQKFVIDIGNQKSVAMTFDGAPLSGLPDIQNSNVVVRNLVLTRDRASIAGAAVDLHTLTTPPVVKSAATPKVAPIVPPPAIATRMENLAKQARANAAHNAKAKSTVPRAHPPTNSTKHSTRTKKGKSSSIPLEQIHPVQPIPPGP